MIVITGATGNTGNPLAHALLDAGETVRAVGRSADRMKDLTDKGAEAFEADVTDRDAVRKAFAGADAVYAMVPPKMDAPDLRAYYNQVADNYVTAIRENGVQRVVALSSVGADIDHSNGPIKGLHDLEQKFSALDKVDVLFLRPGYFMENTLGQIGLVKQMGTMGSTLDPEIGIGMIATRDIARHAARRMIERDFSGHSHKELQGPRDVRFPEVASVLGRSIGKPDLGYTQFSPEQAFEGMTGMGMPEQMAELYIEMERGINEDKVAFRATRDDRSVTPTSIEDFAVTWKQAYQQS